MNLSRSARSVQFSLTYNSAGLISQVTDAQGRVTSYSYNSTNQLLLKVTNVKGTTQYTYTTQPSAPEQYTISSIANLDGTHAYFSYDVEGRIISQPNDGGAQNITFAYGAGAQATSTDALGNSTVTLFNEFGQPGQITDPLGRSTEFTYDSNRNLVLVAGPGAVTYSYAYDARGNLLRETDPLGNVTQFSYTSQFGHLQNFTDPNGNTAKYSYSATGDLLNITYPDGSQQQFSYNPLGSLTESIDGNGNPIDYQYNINGQLTRKDFSDGTSAEYSYDAHGNMVSASNSTGPYTLQYNSADLLIESTDPFGHFLKFTYDSGGRRTQSSDQTGFTVNYSYDVIGRLERLSDSNDNVIVSYTYDAAGHLITKDLGNGTHTVYTYDAESNVLSITNYAPDHSTINSFDLYTYDEIGNVLSDTSQIGEWIYSYDADSHLDRAVFTPDSANAGGLTAQNIDYVYDPDGNRTSESANGIVTTYVVNDVDEILSSTTAGQGTTSFTYDRNGNLLSELSPTGSLTNYTLNSLGKLITITTQNSIDLFKYDPFGNRVAEVAGDLTTIYQVDPEGLGTIAATYTGLRNEITNYTYGLGLVSQVRHDATVYYDFGRNGSTIGLSDSNGLYVDTYIYLPFGEQATLSQSVPNIFTYSGQSGAIEDGNGFYNMRARIYLAAQGRFSSRDALGINAGINSYTYVQNNPENYIDPSGNLVEATFSPFGTFLSKPPIGPEGGIDPVSGGGTGGFGGSGYRPGPAPQPLPEPEPNVEPEPPAPDGVKWLQRWLKSRPRPNDKGQHLDVQASEIPLMVSYEDL
jgi:RHS repeat-associated protein